MIFLMFACTLIVVSVLASTFFSTDKALAKWGLTGALAPLVGLFVVLAKQNSPTMHLSLVLGAKEQALDTSDLRWSQPCELHVADPANSARTVRVKVAVVRLTSAPGCVFQVKLPASVVELLTEDSTVALALTDAKGVKWEVEPFRPFDRSVDVSVAPAETRKFLTAYQDEDV